MPAPPSSWKQAAVKAVAGGSHDSPVANLWASPDEPNGLGGVVGLRRRLWHSFLGAVPAVDGEGIAHVDIQARCPSTIRHLDTPPSRNLGGRTGRSADQAVTYSSFSAPEGEALIPRTGFGRAWFA